MSKVSKKNSGFFNIETAIVLVLVALVFYIVYTINDSIVSYTNLKSKFDKVNADLITTKEVVANQKLQITNLNKELVMTQQNYDELLAKKSKVIEKTAAVKKKKEVKEKEVIDNDVQLKTSGTLSEESLDKLSEIRSLALIEHYSSLFNTTQQPSI
jgi:hypothetical protein